MRFKEFYQLSEAPLNAALVNRTKRFLAAGIEPWEIIQFWNKMGYKVNMKTLRDIASEMPPLPPEIAQQIFMQTAPTVMQQPRIPLHMLPKKYNAPHDIDEPSTSSGYSNPSGFGYGTGGGRHIIHSGKYRS